MESIKLQIAKYFIFILLQPTLNAKTILNFANCFTGDIKKILVTINSLKSTQLIALDMNKYDDKSIDSRKILGFLSFQPILPQFLDALGNSQLIKTIMHTGLEWHLYTNMQIKQVCKILHLVKKNSYCFFVCHMVYFDRLANYSSKYLSAFNVNLKSVQCTAYQYFDNAIYLGSIYCTSSNNCNYYCKPSKQAVANLMREVKRKLYHKNNNGYWRASAYVCPAQALVSIEKILQLWLTYYSGLLSNKQILTINRIADYIFYKWQVK